MTTLITGGTGFIGSAVIEQLLQDGHRPIVLVRRAVPLTSRLGQHAASGRVTILRGNLDLDSLGIDRETIDRLAATVTHVIHCAAHYRLSASCDAVEVNVAGTRRLLDIVADWPLTGFHHVSSIVAAGKAGDSCIPEAGLSRPQGFRNHYETSKWEAECLVGGYAGRIPIRIYRPGIVIGDSVTGETPKFDGPYPAFRFGHPLLPVIVGGPADRAFPLVTVDLVAETLCAGIRFPPVGAEPEYANLIDLSRPGLRQFAAEMAIRVIGHRCVIAIPAVMLRALGRLPGFSWATGIERQALDYMGLSWRFRTDALERLCGRAGIDAYRLDRGYDAIAGYYALHTGRPFRPKDDTTLYAIDRKKSRDQP